jgi:hypothetical protein
MSTTEANPESATSGCCIKVGPILLSVIIKNPYNLQAWIDLVLFLSCCLKVAGGRGGCKDRKALAGKLNEVIHAYPGMSVATIGLPCINRVAAAHKSYNKRTKQERMAARVSEMLEEGDVKGAVWPAAIE